MGLEIEKVEKSGRKKGVASYVDPVWEKWLQEKIQLYDKGKVIPPANIMQESLEHSVHDKLGQEIAAEILEQNHYADQVAEAVRQVKQCCLDSQIRLAETVQAELKKEPVNRWKDVVETMCEEMIKNSRF